MLCLCSAHRRTKRDPLSPAHPSPRSGGEGDLSGDFPDGYTGSRTLAELTALFDACFRIQREAIEAAGHHIPLVVENVRGAQPWVGRSAWNFGSYHLYGDVPALMPFTFKAEKNGGNGSWFYGNAATGGNPARGVSVGEAGTKNTGGSWFNIGSPGQTETNNNPVHRQKSGGRVNRPDHTQVIDPERGTKGYAARLGDSQISRRHGSKSTARKAASAKIAKIPFPLASHIARVYRPKLDTDESDRAYAVAQVAAIAETLDTEARDLTTTRENTDR